MAKNFKYHGHTVSVLTASAAMTSGKPCVQEGFFGIALNDAALNATNELGIDGVWNIPVPASTVKGDYLYVPGANGVMTESADVTGTLTRTGSNANTPVGKAIEARRADGTADVLILPGVNKGATQV